MAGKRKRGWSRLFVDILGLLCALTLGAVFYGTMVYQLAGEEKSGAKAAVERIDLEKLPQDVFPGPVLALSGLEPAKDMLVDLPMGGEICRAAVKDYLLDSGAKITAVSAAPAAFLEVLSTENFVPQLITGFTLDGLEAVYSVRGAEALLTARDGDLIYMLRVPADEQLAYQLGVQTTRLR